MKSETPSLAPADAHRLTRRYAAQAPDAFHRVSAAAHVSAVARASFAASGVNGRSMIVSRPCARRAGASSCLSSRRHLLMLAGWSRVRDGSRRPRLEAHRRRKCRRGSPSPTTLFAVTSSAARRRGRVFRWMAYYADLIAAAAESPIVGAAGAASAVRRRSGRFIARREFICAMNPLTQSQWIVTTGVV